MEAAIANITFDRDWRDADIKRIGRIVHRLRVLIRRHRIGRTARAKAQLIFFENADPHILADIGIDPMKYRRYDWLKEAVRAMGCGPL